MYICEDCGKVFDEPKTYEECMGEFWGAPAYETFAICPFCESEAFKGYDPDMEKEEYDEELDDSLVLDNSDVDY